jgi:SAM-dependent methyltransferase
MIKEVLCAKTQIRSPKRGKESRTGRASWYEYYAGFSTHFVQDALYYAELESRARILDPWNGSGTTTEIASAHGFEVLGFDLNPVMVIVAKARLLGPTVQASLKSLLDDLLIKAARTDHEQAEDPLETWFKPSSAAALRRFERAIQTLLIDPRDYRTLFDQPTLSQVSSLAAFFYVGAFRVLRELLAGFRSANPTWIKQPASAADRITVRENRLHKLLREQVTIMATGLGTPVPHSVNPYAATIDRAGSAALPIDDFSVDAVISSPPYCTRIDYVKKTSPELAFLGANAIALKRLRYQMIGTPTIHKAMPQQEPAWGKACLDVVEAISNHKSYASKSYYWKTYMQYFSGLHQSLREIDRTLKPAGQCILVVQDSYYKDIHIDLAEIINEMAHCLGWATIVRVDFPIAKTMVGLNTHAVENGNPKHATETVLGFRKRQ